MASTSKCAQPDVISPSLRMRNHFTTIAGPRGKAPMWPRPRPLSCLQTEKLVCNNQCWVDDAVRAKRAATKASQQSQATIPENTARRVHTRCKLLYRSYTFCTAASAEQLPRNQIVHASQQKKTLPLLVNMFSLPLVIQVIQLCMAQSSTQSIFSTATLHAHTAQAAIKCCASHSQAAVVLW